MIMNLLYKNKFIIIITIFKIILKSLIYYTFIYYRETFKIIKIEFLKII